MGRYRRAALVQVRAGVAVSGSAALVTDFSNLAEQMRQTYVNAGQLLKRFGVSPIEIKFVAKV